MWVERRSKCKGGMVILYGPKHDNDSKFTKDKWYTTFYETWSDDPIHNKDMYRVNDGWKNYKATDNMLETRILSRAYYNIIFYSDIELRNELIDEIIE